MKKVTQSLEEKTELRSRGVRVGVDVKGRSPDGNARTNFIIFKEGIRFVQSPVSWGKTSQVRFRNGHRWVTR